MFLYISERAIESLILVLISSGLASSKVFNPYLLVLINVTHLHSTNLELTIGDTLRRPSSAIFYRQSRLYPHIIVVYINMHERMYEYMFFTATGMGRRYIATITEDGVWKELLMKKYL